MRGFRWIKSRDSWSRRKKMTDGSTAIIEFWKAATYEPFDFGIWICLIPKGRWREILRDYHFCESTGNGSFDHLPFFTDALKDFISENPSARIVASAEDVRRERLYRKILTRYGFVEYPFGIGYEDWAMVLDCSHEAKEETQDGT